MSELAQQIVDAGFAPNLTLLENNGSLQTQNHKSLPAFWSLPSRLFQFPIGYSKREGLWLKHPLLADHPYVKIVEDRLKITIPFDGGDDEEPRGWSHAVDLMSKGLYKDLLATARFTSRRDISGAVVFCLRHYGGHDEDVPLSIHQAHAFMKSIRAPEPRDRISTIKKFMKPSATTDESGRLRWPINTFMDDSPAVAWAFIHGIEDKWFTRDSTGHLGWSREGRDMLEGKVVQGQLF